MDPGHMWRRKSDEEVKTGAQHLGEYTEAGQQAIWAEVQRRGLAAASKPSKQSSELAEAQRRGLTASGTEAAARTMSRPSSLGAEIHRRLVSLFAADEQEEAAQIIMELQRSLSYAEEAAFGLERIQSAALRVSHGNLGRLQKAIEVGRVDFRDLLGAASFYSPTAHERWEPTPGKISRWERVRERLFGIR